MICEACHGSGGVPGIWVCAECQGSGLAHCCEGERPGNVPPAKVHPSLIEGPAGYACPSLRSDDEAILRYFYEPRDVRDVLPYDRPANGGDDER